MFIFFCIITRHHVLQQFELADCIDSMILIIFVFVGHSIRCFFCMTFFFVWYHLVGTLGVLWKESRRLDTLFTYLDENAAGKFDIKSWSSHLSSEITFCFEQLRSEEHFIRRCTDYLLYINALQKQKIAFRQRVF